VPRPRRAGDPVPSQANALQHGAARTRALVLATSRSIAALLAQASFPDRTGIFGNPRLGDLVPRPVTRVEQQRHPQAVREAHARAASEPVPASQPGQQRLGGESLADDAWLSALDTYSVISTNPCWTS
jgi:hypothetical protein